MEAICSKRGDLACLRRLLERLLPSVAVLALLAPPADAQQTRGGSAGITIGQEEVTSLEAASNASDFSQAKIDLDIEGEEVAEAMKTLSEATGLTILVSGKATGKVSAYIRGMDPEAALEQTLRVNGLRFVRQGNVVWALTEQEYIDDFNMGREHRVLPLQHAKAFEVATVLQSELGKNGRIVPYPDTNVLVLAEAADRIEELVSLAARLDEAPETRVFQLQHAAALDAFNLLQAHVSSPSALQADVRTNQIVVTDTPDRLGRFATLLDALDQPDKVDTRAFALRYANADEVAALLREMLTGRSSSSAYGQAGSDSRSSPLDGAERRRPFTTEPGRGRAATPLQEWQARHAPAPPTEPTAGPSPQPATVPATPALPVGRPEDTAPQGTPLDENVALGPLETVVADSRTNTVIVTHVASTLDRIAEVIKTIDVPSELHVYQFMNADPSQLDLETKLAGLLSQTGAYFNVEPLTRKVSWRSGPEQAEQILGLLKEWDQAVPQVRIEAEILSVSANLVRKLGISWQAILEEVDNGIIDRNIDVQVDFPSAIGDTSPQGRLSVGTLETDDYTATLQAVETDSDTEVIATPRILVKDGQDALFSSARDEPYTVVTVNGDTNTTMQDVRFLNVGVTLGVLPTINEEGLIAMEVQLEISSLAAVRNGVPVVDRSTAQSVVNVRDGGTVILGGLRQRSRSLSNEGVPGLKKLPLLGSLFRNRTRDRGESEIILILRPRLIGPGQAEVPKVEDVAAQSVNALKDKSLSSPTGDVSADPVQTK